MPEKGDQPHAPRHNTYRLSKQEIDRLVQGVDDIYFGGMEPDDEQKPLPEQQDHTPRPGDETK